MRVWVAGEQKFSLFTTSFNGSGHKFKFPVLSNTEIHVVRPFLMHLILLLLASQLQTPGPALGFPYPPASMPRPPPRCSNSCNVSDSLFFLLFPFWFCLLIPSRWWPPHFPRQSWCGLLSLWSLLPSSTTYTSPASWLPLTSSTPSPPLRTSFLL